LDTKEILSMLINPNEIKIGCSVFDAEHVALVNMINAIHKLLKEGNRQKAKEIFQKGLVEYTEKHLAHEEKVMEKFGYPDLEMHKKSHEMFKRVIAEGIKNLDDPKAFASEAAMAMGWIFSHVQKTDKKYVDYFKEKGCWEEACEMLEQPVELEIEEELRQILGPEYVEVPVKK
jgi:hemerythrin